MMYIDRIVIAIIVSFTVLNGIRAEQAGCEETKEQFEFYKEYFRDGLEEECPSNYVCKASFKARLQMCISVLRDHLSHGIQTAYKLKPDAKNVTKHCEKHDIHFSLVQDNLETRSVEFFRCPIEQMQYEIITGRPLPKQTDFYITKGWAEEPGKTIFMLRPSNTTDNLCVLGEYFWNGLE